MLTSEFYTLATGIAPKEINENKLNLTSAE